MPIGTLAANLIGGYLIGWRRPFFALRHELAPVKLFTDTGVLGGFTTFSAFSSNEVVSLLAEGRPGWAAFTAAAHVAGSLGLTALGILTVRTLA